MEENWRRTYKISAMTILIALLMAGGLAVMESVAGWDLTVKPDFYKAAASVLPLLLLGQVVRLNSAKAKNIQEGLTVIKRLGDEGGILSNSTREGNENIAAFLLITLAFFAFGIAAVLVVLAIGSDNLSAFFLSVLGIGWGLLSLLVFEWILFIWDPTTESLPEKDSPSPTSSS